MQRLPNCQYHNLSNSEVLNLKQSPITCIYELQLCKTNGDFKVYGHVISSADKYYVDKNAITTVGGVVSGDIQLNVGSDLVRRLECNDLTTGKKFTLLLRTDTNMLSYSVPDSQFPVPIKIKTDGCFLILINKQPICDFGQDAIFCS